MYNGVEYTFQIECNTTNVTLRISDSTLELSNIASEDYEFSIYPNPVNEEATIVLNASEKFLSSNEIIELSIYNFLGLKVKSIDNLSEENMTIKRNGLTTGLYFITLYSNGRLLETSKIIFD
jgi:hypothetical protein